MLKIIKNHYITVWSCITDNDCSILIRKYPWNRKKKKNQHNKPLVFAITKFCENQRASLKSGAKTAVERCRNSIISAIHDDD